MGLVTNGWRLRVSLADNGANVTTKRYELTAADAATAATDVAAIIAALNAVTNAVIVTYAYGEEFAEETVVYPAAGIENEDKASITCLLTTGGGKKGNLKIPAPVIGIFSSPTGTSANIVDVLDADLITYANLFGVAGEAYISDGEILDSMQSGKRISAGSQRG
jgi:hypothetical protein